ncbi:MAG: insulinase family protein [Phycisphaerales bacterium]|nr:insulinase family protein [Phycisphaerales bacterium]
MKSSFVEHQLPNGLRIVCEVMPNVNSASAGFLVLTGSRHEAPHEHGVSHFLEHMCFKGNEKRDWRDINVRFDELGSIYNAFTGKEHTVYYGWVPAERFVDQLELLAGLVRPSLPDGEFQTERNVILEEIAMNGDSFGWHVSNFLHQTMFEKHPLAHEILGERDTIAGLALNTMRDYRDERYSPRNMVLVAAGNIDPQEAFAYAGRYCADWAPHANGQRSIAPPAAFPAGVRKLHLDRFQQQELIVAYPCAAAGDPDEENLEAFCALFGGPNSRCYWNFVQ